MTTAADLRFSQTLAEVKAGYPQIDARSRQLQAEARERYEARRFDVALTTGPFYQATGGKWENVTRQQAIQVLMSMGLERVPRNDQAKYVLILREWDHAGNEIGHYMCRVGSFPGVKLTDWKKEIQNLHNRR